MLLATIARVGPILYVVSIQHTVLLSNVLYFHVHASSIKMGEWNTHNVSYSIQVQTINDRDDLGHLKGIRYRLPSVKTKEKVAWDS